MGRRRWMWLGRAALVLALAAGQPPARAQAPDAVGAAAAGLDLARGRFFPETGYRVDDDAIWSFFRARGGLDVFGYPVSRPFTLLGCRVQLFQRQMVQLCQGSEPRLMNVLDPELFPYTRVNGSTFPAPDETLKAATPRVGDPDYARHILEFVRATAPDTFAGLAVNFGRTFFGLIGPETAGTTDAGIVGLVNLEVWGAPISRPMADPANPRFVYQRFQRGIMHFDATTGVTRGILLADYLKQILLGPERAGTGLPADLRKQARGSRYFAQYCPGRRGALCRPAELPATDLSDAFEEEQPFVVDATASGLQYGFQADLRPAAARATAIARTAAAGFGWLKQQVAWDQVEVAPGVYDPAPLADLDALVEQTHRAGLHLLLSLAKAPAFYAPPGGGAPRDPAPLGTFLRFLAERYRGRVQAYEPWNEPNLAREWGAGRLWPDGPQDLVRLLRVAYAGVRAGDAGALVVFPGLAPSGAGGCETCARLLAIDDRLHLHLVYRVNDGEVAGAFDVLGAHPFGHDNPPGDWTDHHTVPGTAFKDHPSFYFRRFTQLREVMLAHGDDKPMWLTEVGWDACGRTVPGYEYCRDNSEADQARYLADALALLRASYPYVTHVFVWNLNFPMLVPEDDERWGFGVLRPDGSPRPAYLALQVMDRGADSR